MRFYDNQWFPRAILVWTFAITIARAIRLPNDFAEAHWLLDYRFGFMKRGLVGTLCNAVGSVLDLAISPGVIVLLSALVLGLFAGALFKLLFRLLRAYPADTTGAFVGLVFVSSPFIVMNAHLFGYFDGLLYALAILAAVFVLDGHPLLSALVSAVALLIHESFLFLGLPLVALAVHAATPTDGHKPAWRTYAAALGLPFVVLGVIVLYQSLIMDQDLLRRQLRGYLESFDFIPTRARRVAQWHTTGFFQFFRQERVHFGARVLDPALLGLLGPSLAALLACIHARFPVRPFGKTSLLVFGAVFAPLAMHAIAWDTARIATYTIGNAFIATWIISRTHTPDNGARIVALLAPVTVVLNLFCHLPLMDGQVERFGGFLRLVLYAPAIVLLVLLLRAPVSSTQAGGSGVATAREPDV